MNCVKIKIKNKSVRGAASKSRGNKHRRDRSLTSSLMKLSDSNESIIKVCMFESKSLK